MKVGYRWTGKVLTDIIDHMFDTVIILLDKDTSNRIGGSGDV